MLIGADLCVEKEQSIYILYVWKNNQVKVGIILGKKYTPRKTLIIPKTLLSEKVRYFC